MKLKDCTQRQDVYSTVLKNLALCNMPLCCLILLLNSLVITCYFRLSNKLTYVMIVLISISDVATSLGHLILDVGVLTLPHDPAHTSNLTATALAMSYSFLAVFGYSCSIFFNVVLAVLRTLRIVFPFYRVNLRALWLTLSVHIALLYLLCMVDLFYELRTGNMFNMPLYTLWFNVNISFVGHDLVYCLRIIFSVAVSSKNSLVCAVLLLTLLFMAPVSVVTLCLITQLFVLEYRRFKSGQSRYLNALLRWASRGTARSETSDNFHSFIDWTHVNVTVFLLSLVFAVCNSGISVLTLYYKTMYKKVGVGGIEVCYLQGIVSTTMPLLSALLSPIILISRSANMRQKFAWFFTPIARAGEVMRDAVIRKMSEAAETEHLVPTRTPTENMEIMY